MVQRGCAAVRSRPRTLSWQHRHLTMEPSVRQRLRKVADERRWLPIEACVGCHVRMVDGERRHMRRVGDEGLLPRRWGKGRVPPWVPAERLRRRPCHSDRRGSWVKAGERIVGSRRMHIGDALFARCAEVCAGDGGWQGRAECAVAGG